MKTNTNDSSVSDLDQNSEDVLTRHLLKLSEVEDQFRELTTLELHPSQSFVSSSKKIETSKLAVKSPSIGNTGSVSLIPRPSKIFKQFPDVGVTISETEVPDAFHETSEITHGPYFFSGFINNLHTNTAFLDGVDISTYFTASSSGLLNQVNALTEARKNKKKFTTFMK